MIQEWNPILSKNQTSLTKYNFEHTTLSFEMNAQFRVK